MVPHCTLAPVSATSFVLNNALICVLFFVFHTVKGDTALSLDMLSTAVWRGLCRPLCDQCSYHIICSAFWSRKQSSMEFTLSAFPNGGLVVSVQKSLWFPSHTVLLSTHECLESWYVMLSVPCFQDDLETLS